MMKKVLKKTVKQDPKTSVLPIFRLLLDNYPNPKTELTYDGPFQLLIAVILSAQCTDVRVNQVTPELFRQFPTPEKMAAASPLEIEKLIHSCGFYRMKTKALINTSKELVEKFNSKVPSTIEELIKLQGVGRKTASVVLNQAYDEPAIAVDTHVNRVANRLGWVSDKNPVKVESALKELLPKHLWSTVNGLLILHGRKTCKARRPLCEECQVKLNCSYFLKS